MCMHSIPNKSCLTVPTPISTFASSCSKIIMLYCLITLATTIPTSCINNIFVCFFQVRNKVEIKICFREYRRVS